MAAIARARCAAVARLRVDTYRLSSPPLRAFSSARAPLPPVGAWDYFKRMVERRGVYEAYKKQSVFSPGMSGVKSWLLFGVVQLPQETVVDLPEFLEGAKLAAASVLQATSSADFTKFITGETTQSENADRLREWCTPNCYEVLADNVRHSWERKRMFEVEDVEAERAFLTMSRFDRVTPEELESDATLAQQVMMQRRWSPDATVERLQLNVGLVAKERTRQTFFDDKKVRVVDCNWYYQAAFMSEVTSSSDIDWRVAAIVAERGLGQTLISESPLVEGDVGAGDGDGEPTKEP